MRILSWFNINFFSSHNLFWFHVENLKNNICHHLYMYMKICKSVRSFIELQSYGKLKQFPIIKKEKSRILSVIFRHFNFQMFSEICFCETKTICCLTETSLLKLTLCTLPLGMQAAPSSIPTSGTFYRGDLVMKRFLWPFSLFCWFKKSSCQLQA